MALGAAYVQFRLFRTNGLLWSLAACSLLVPLIDRLLPGGARTAGRESRSGGPHEALARPAPPCSSPPSSGHEILAFCGFYVAKADTKLFNQASQVALVRDGDRTVLTMANDFQGDPKEFALVVPVPTFIERRQIEVVDKALLDHLDAFTAPRLVEYFDDDPCAHRRSQPPCAMSGAGAAACAG